MVNFFLLLIKKNRIDLLSNLIKDFERLILEKKQCVKVKVKSANELDKDEKLQIEGFIKSEYNKSIVIDYERDLSILAGFKIYVENKQYVSTVENLLEKFKLSLN